MVTQAVASDTLHRDPRGEITRSFVTDHSPASNAPAGAQITHAVAIQLKQKEGLLNEYTDTDNILLGAFPTLLQIYRRYGLPTYWITASPNMNDNVLALRIITNDESEKMQEMRTNDKDTVSVPC